MRLLDELVAVAVPPRCAACRAPLRRAGAVLCAGCRRALPWLGEPRCPRCALPLGAPPAGAGARARAAGGGAAREHALACPAQRAAFDGAWAAVAYAGSARAALHALKFSAARALAEVMAAQIAAGAPPAPGATLVAVPPHPLRARARGFDPAALIAAALARRSGLDLARALRRDGGPGRQLGASRAQRRDAARLRFSAVARAPARAVLVDDVHTTGATLDACARALRDAGAETVQAVTWARTLDDRRR